MLRTFAEHAVRRTRSLDGFWDFVIEPDRKKKSGLPRTYDRRIRVPVAWENLPGLEAYRGRAWLRTRFNAVEGKVTRIVFGGVSHTGTVYVDGRKRTSHYGAYTPWDVLVDLAPGEHELVVEVDNAFGPHSALHVENDYYTYGGITRPVELQHVDGVFVDKLFAVPRRTGRTWSLDVRVRLVNPTKRRLRRRVTLNVAGRTLDMGRITVEPGKSREKRGTLEKLNVDPWSPESPKLYDATVTLFDGDEPVDDLVDRIGFREVKTKRRKILLNGRPIFLQGYNRHEDHPQFGCAVPLEAMVTDLAIMRDLGCNFVRTAHYPNDMRFLDLCDEMGFCVWEESHARAIDVHHPNFREQIADSTTRMIEWHFNRPSILMWGCLNECESGTKRGRREYAYVLKMMKKLDPSRPVTFASCYRQRDICLDLVDIVSFNDYPAWYGTKPDAIEPSLKSHLKWLRSNKSKAKDKPFILSEFGAGGIYGWRHPSHAKWTEEYQCDVLDESLRVVLNHPDVAGAAIWQFCDVRVTEGAGVGGRPWFYGRPRCMNNKGTVDEYRRAKLVYEVVKKRMREASKRRARKR